MFKLSLLALLAFGTALLADQVELLPQPRQVENPLKFEKIIGGYQVTMGKKNAELFLDALKMVEDEKGLGDLIQTLGKDATEEKTKLAIAYWTHVVTKELPVFKKTLGEKIGPNGVVVKMYGFDATKERPVLKALSKAFVPKEVQEQVDGVRAMINTKGVYWRIESRE